MRKGFIPELGLKTRQNFRRWHTFNRQKFYYNALRNRRRNYLLIHCSINRMQKRKGVAYQVYSYPDGIRRKAVALSDRPSGLEKEIPHITLNRPNIVVTEENEFLVLGCIQENPETSVRQISHTTGISAPSVHRIITKHKYHRYHIQLHQELLAVDFPRREAF
ncbi:hypothetical protein NQ318_009924 [Aromia moschata]|uniref:Uncharacterized protein n=1 Tax=Aromia moschata TaxID=1265417 RepID=A0AAV8YCZ5_9CUCU|nr:hypothetical protein NQ318_009924 [Aromia moschata]